MLGAVWCANGPDFFRCPSCAMRQASQSFKKYRPWPTSCHDDSASTTHSWTVANQNDLQTFRTDWFFLKESNLLTKKFYPLTLHCALRRWSNACRESAIVETVSMSRPRGWGAGGSGGEANISWSTDQMTRPTYQIKPTYQSSYIYIKIIKINIYIYIYILYVSYSNPWFPNSLESFGNGFVKARTFAGKIVIMIGDKIKLVYRIYHLWHLMLFDESNPTITYNNGPWNILFQHITDVCGTSCNAMWRIW